MKVTVAVAEDGIGGAFRPEGDVRAVTITHPAGYLVEGGRWLNDEAADAYQPNGFGGGGVPDLTRAR